MFTVGITGGIGSGKSTVCRMLAMLGASVYDSDARARALMNTDDGLVRGIKSLLGGDAYRDGAVDRSYVASRIFTDPGLLAAVNALVHPAVRRDFAQWRDGQAAHYVVLECAILFEGGFDDMVDRVAVVAAPADVRLRRVMARDGVTEERVRERMANQLDEEQRLAGGGYVVVNDDQRLLWSQVLELDDKLKDESRR